MLPTCVLELIPKLLQCILAWILSFLAVGCGLLAWIPQQTQTTTQNQNQNATQVGDQKVDQYNIEVPTPPQTPSPPDSQPTT